MIQLQLEVLKPKLVCALLDDHKSRGSGLAPWPARLTVAPPCLAYFGHSKDIFEKDSVIETVLP